MSPRKPNAVVITSSPGRRGYRTRVHRTRTSAGAGHDEEQGGPHTFPFTSERRALLADAKGDLIFGIRAARWVQYRGPAAVGTDHAVHGGNLTAVRSSDSLGPVTTSSAPSHSTMHR